MCLHIDPSLSAKDRNLKFVLDMFLCAFVQFREATISFVLSVRPSTRIEQLGSHWTDFHEI